MLEKSAGSITALVTGRPADGRAGHQGGDRAGALLQHGGQARRQQSQQRRDGHRADQDAGQKTQPPLAQGPHRDALDEGFVRRGFGGGGEQPPQARIKLVAHHAHLPAGATREAARRPGPH